MRMFDYLLGPLEQPGSIKVVRSTSGDAMDVTFQGFDTSNGPIVAYAIIVTTDLNGRTSKLNTSMHLYK